MKSLKILFSALACLAFVNAFADLDDNELRQIRDFIKYRNEGKPAISIRKDEGNLVIGGDISTKCKVFSEKRNGQKVVGTNNQPPCCGDDKDRDQSCRASNEATIEANLITTYTCEKTKAVMQLRFKNALGLDEDNVPEGGSTDGCRAPLGSGKKNSLALRRAYVEYELFEKDSAKLKVDLGRQMLSDLFFSDIQFDTRFDGLVLKYSDACEGKCTYYANVGAMLIDTRNRHYAYALEVGADKIMDTGLYAKYSNILWRKKGLDPHTGKRDTPRFKFDVSQVTLGYMFGEELIGVPMDLYGAYAYNHAAKRDPSQLGTNAKKNSAWFAGIVFGQLRKKGDWSVVVDYQYVEPQAIPKFDVSGIGSTAGSCKCNDYANRANYKGYEVEGAYSLTNNLVFKAAYRDARATVKGTKVNGILEKSHKYREIEGAVVYAF